MRLTLLLIAGLVVLGATGFLRLAGQLQKGVERQYAQAAEEPMVDMAQLLAALLETGVADGEIRPAALRDTFASAYQREFEAKIYELRKTRLFTHVFVTDRSGLVLFDSEQGLREGQNFSQFREIFRALRGEYGARSTRMDPENSLSSVFYVAAPVRHRGEIIGAVSVSRPEWATMGNFVVETQRQIQAAAVATAVVVILAGAAWAYLLLRPISRIDRQAREVAAGARGPLPETGIAELKTLSRNLEAMRQTLEGRKYAEQYVQNLTHELKSPLAAIQGAAELLQDPAMPGEKRKRFAENIRAEAQRAAELVGRMLQLSALERKSALERREEVEFALLVRRAVEQAETDGQPRGLRWELALPDDGARLMGDPFTLEIAIANLFSNAADFSPAQGAIQVRLGTDGKGWELEVRDHGPGIPDYARQRIFERFFSLKHEVSGRKGSGLGLCFVREAAELHGGEISLENHPEGGAVARFWVPLGFP